MKYRDQVTTVFDNIESKVKSVIDNLQDMDKDDLSDDAKIVIENAINDLSELADELY